jgi:carboxymethylenebutenolidase
VPYAAIAAIVQFCGGKIAHEHIHWDHASLLKQLGVLANNGLPIAGIEGARTVSDPALPANTLIAPSKPRAQELVFGHRDLKAKPDC